MSEERENQFEEIMEEKKGEDDRISALPDCLLLDILSRFPYTKDTIRTGALSKRWQHLWTRVPTLSFILPSNSNSRSNFILSVDKTLTQCCQLKLKKFQLLYNYDIRYESHYRNWIRFAISCNVEELNLEFRRMQGEFVLYQFFFINSCFTHLRLQGCKLNPSGAISWENLRSLSISRVDLDEELLANIVSGSPLLESLALEYCKWPHIPSELESAPTSLSLIQCHELKHLKKFKLCIIYDSGSHQQISNSIRYAIRCNVKELNLEFNRIYVDEFMIDQMLFTGSCITELRLEGCNLNPVGAISWKSLRTLRISEYRSLDEDLIENILSGSPVLETLKLHGCYGYKRLDITSKSVKNLVLNGFDVPYGESEDDVIEINAPHILSLRIEDGTFWCKPLFLNVSSLVKAYFNYRHHRKTSEKVEQETLKGLIMNLRHVKELELGSLCAKVLSCLEAQGFVSPSNVKLSGRM